MRYINTICGVLAVACFTCCAWGQLSKVQTTGMGMSQADHRSIVIKLPPGVDGSDWSWSSARGRLTAYWLTEDGGQFDVDAQLDDLGTLELSLGAPPADAAKLVIAFSRDHQFAYEARAELSREALADASKDLPPLNFSAIPRRTISTVVKSLEGDPLAGQPIALMEAYEEGTNQVAVATTDASGKISFDAWADRDYWLMPKPGGVVRDYHQLIEAAQGKETPAEFRLSLTDSVAEAQARLEQTEDATDGIGDAEDWTQASIEVFVQDDLGQAIGGAQVVLVRRDRQGLHETWMGESGSAGRAFIDERIYLPDHESVEYFACVRQDAGPITCAPLPVMNETQVSVTVPLAYEVSAMAAWSNAPHTPTLLVLRDDKGATPPVQILPLPIGQTFSFALPAGNFRIFVGDGVTQEFRSAGSVAVLSDASAVLNIDVAKRGGEAPVSFSELVAP